MDSRISVGSEQKALSAATGAREEFTAQTEQPVMAEEEEEEAEEDEVAARFELLHVAIDREKVNACKL